eukprot:scaffold871_cov130-Cylindrotheca_fusiformis.AAC.26
MNADYQTVAAHVSSIATVGPPGDTLSNNNNGSSGSFDPNQTQMRGEQFKQQDELESKATIGQTEVASTLPETQANDALSGSSMTRFDPSDDTLFNNNNNKNGRCCNKLDLLTVFQAAPLAGKDVNGKDQAVGELDWELERNLLQKTFEGSQVAVEFEIATTDALGSFLAPDQGRILHFSCHGDEHRLYLEDNWGGVCTLPKEQIKEWIEVGGRNLQFVFVSACSSRNIGQAFVDANVPHVVCCYNESEVSDVAAAEFAKSFYRKLMHGTLKDAFDIACHEILVSPNIPRQNRRREAEQFCLLPAGGDHDVPIFFQRPITVTEKKRFIPPVRFPPPPQVFIGRQVDQFHILSALRFSRLVSVSGARGVGKADLIKSLCAYIIRRLHMVDVHDIVWVPYQEEIRSGEPFCYFQGLMKIFNDASPTSQFFDKARTHIAKLVEYYRLPKTLLVIDAKEFSTMNGLGKLGLFLEEFIKDTRNARVIVIHQLGAEIATTRIRTIEKHIRVEPLSYDDTVKLVATLCPHMDLYSRLASPLGRPNRMTKRTALIFNRMGAGNPQSIQSFAREMTRDETGSLYKKLVLLGEHIDDIPLESERFAEIEERMEEAQNALSIAKSNGDRDLIVEHQEILEDLEKQKISYSRAAVEQKQKDALDQILEAAKKSDFSRAEELQITHDDLEKLKQKLPTLGELKGRFDKITSEIELAVDGGEWFKATRLRTELDRLESAIRSETNAENANLVDADKELMATRASLEARIMQLEMDYNVACDANNFEEARNIVAESKRLEVARSTKPAGVDLARKVRELQYELERAKVGKNIDAAERIFKRLEVTRAKLKVEQDAESTLGIKVASDSVINKSQNGPISLVPSARQYSCRSNQSISSIQSDPPGDVGARIQPSKPGDEKAYERNRRNSALSLAPQPYRPLSTPQVREPDSSGEQEEHEEESPQTSPRRNCFGSTDRPESPESHNPSPGAFRIGGSEPNNQQRTSEVSVVWCWKETSADLSNYTNRPSIVHGDPKDGWIKYRRRHIAMLESVYQSAGPRRECVLDVTPHTYKVDMNTMTQTNIRTGYTREVRRFVDDAPPSTVHRQYQSYLPAVTVSAIPNATEVSNDTLEEQVVLEQMIVNTLRKHAVPAQQVLVQQVDSDEGNSSSGNSRLGGCDDEVAERESPRIKRFFRKLRSKKK